MALAIGITEPLALTDATLVSSNIAEADYPVWAVGTTYALGDRVIVLAEHAVYESVQAGNTGNTPATSPAWWAYVGATNRWKAFDTSTTSQTLASAGTPTSIEYAIAPGVAINVVAMLNISNATSARIRLNDPTYGDVYDETISLVSTPLASNWWSWFFGQRVTPTSVVRRDLPPYPNATLYLTLTGIDGLGVGVISYGAETSYGLGIRYGAELSIQSFSRVEESDFGEAVFVKRGAASRLKSSMLMLKGETDPLFNRLQAVDGVPCLFVMSEAFSSTTLFGWVEDFSILIEYPEHSEAEITLRSLL